MKKHMISMTDRIWALRGLLTAFCVVAVLWCVSFVSHADTVKGTITGSNVNVRETASTTATAVATLSTNDLVDVIAETTGDDNMKWYKVTTESGVTGYVRSDLIKKATVTVDVTQTDSKTAYIAGSNANIRQDASTSSGRVANALGGSKVTIIGEATGADGYKWYQIQFEGNGTTMTGFIRSDLVTFEAPVQEPEVTEIEGEMGEGSEPSEEPSASEEPSEEPSEESSEEPSEKPSETGKISIPLSGNEGTFIIMEPVSAVEILPQGFEQTELQLGEEVFTVWGKGQFYVMYASVNDGEPQYYLYDAINKSFTAYTGLLTADDVAVADGEKGLNFKLISIICIVIILILAVVVGILAYKLSNAGYRNDDDDDDDDGDYDDDDDIFVDNDEDDFLDLSETANLAEVSETLSEEPVAEEYVNYVPEQEVYETTAEDPIAEFEMYVGNSAEEAVYNASAIDTTYAETVAEQAYAEQVAEQAYAEQVAEQTYTEPVYAEQAYIEPEYTEQVYTDSVNEELYTTGNGTYETQEAVTEEAVILNADAYEQGEDFEETLFEDDEDEEEPKKSRKSKKSKKEKKKFSKRFLDYFTVEVDDDDEDDDEDDDDDDDEDYEERPKKKSTITKFDDDDDDDLNFIDL